MHEILSLQNSESVDDESLLEAESHVVFLNSPRSPSPAPEADSTALSQPPPPPPSSLVEDDAWMFAPVPSPPGDYGDRLFQEALARTTPLEAGAWEAAPLQSCGWRKRHHHHHHHHSRSCIRGGVTRAMPACCGNHYGGLAAQCQSRLALSIANFAIGATNFSLAKLF